MYKLTLIGIPFKYIRAVVTCFSWRTKGALEMGTWRNKVTYCGKLFLIREGNISLEMLCASLGNFGLEGVVQDTVRLISMKCS